MHRLEHRKVSIHKGYETVFYPEHPFSWKKSGNIYLHRIVMEIGLGRYLFPWEHVHHIDANPRNNDPSNLKIVNPSGHKKEHTKLCVLVCSCCEKRFQPKKSGQKCCSSACAQKLARKVNRPSCAELSRLVWEKPTTQLAEDFGVSDVAIAKWCKSFGISKPPRGYWRKTRV